MSQNPEFDRLPEPDKLIEHLRTFLTDKAAPLIVAVETLQSSELDPASHDAVVAANFDGQLTVINQVDEFLADYKR